MTQLPRDIDKLGEALAEHDRKRLSAERLTLADVGIAPQGTPQANIDRAKARRMTNRQPQGGSY